MITCKITIKVEACSLAGFYPNHPQWMCEQKNEDVHLHVLKNLFNLFNSFFAIYLSYLLFVSQISDVSLALLFQFHVHPFELCVTKGKKNSLIPS